MNVRALLDSCDRPTPTWVRNFAMVMLLARLRLGSAEVARLELNDVDWRRGELTICGKVRRHDKLPLPVDVGEARVAYIANARPRIECRQVFITCRAHVRCEGKGRKQRAVPLIGPVKAVMRVWLTERRGLRDEEVFPTHTGRRLSHDAVQRRMAIHTAKAAARCPL
ncbi:site-specific recombinase XerC [Kibdelosporangium banguiense]|uniref:Site-specific recombinase XerC n=1 Tax=Kibdelosporangium banguiense TaxID=1365924 RepID=A0ABS4TYU7_9PSEU|nr:tyrosine-type recombinase/integrase [Kibdelosporangium banguiense]MBP2329572.1 site-specific recombinase XerC [Kibdelosporangium banguiense]